MNVVIVGAGITGVSLAIGLRMLGRSVTLLEARPAAEEIGAGITLWPNGAATLAALGVTFDGWARVFRRSEIRSWRGRTWRQMSMHEVGDLLGQPTLLAGRRDLMAALLRRLEAVGGGVRGGCRVTGISPNGRLVELENRERLACDAIIGADGVSSTVRRARFGAWQSADQGRTSYRALVERSAEIPSRDADFVEYHGRHGRFACYAVGAGRVAWYANVIGPTREAPRSVEELGTWLRGWAPEVRWLVAATPGQDLHLTRIRKSDPLSSRAHGSVALIGDAAQPTTPDLGQGANQGLEDVASVLLALVDHASAERAFAAYQDERHGVAARIAERSAKVGRVSNLEGRTGLWARRLMWGAIPERTSIGGLVDIAAAGVRRAARLSDALTASTRVAHTGAPGRRDDRSPNELGGSRS